MGSRIAKSPRLRARKALRISLSSRMSSAVAFEMVAMDDAGMMWIRSSPCQRTNLLLVGDHRRFAECYERETANRAGFCLALQRWWTTSNLLRQSRARG